MRVLEGRKAKERGWDREVGKGKGREGKGRKRKRSTR